MRVRISSILCEMRLTVRFISDWGRVLLKSNVPEKKHTRMDKRTKAEETKVTIRYSDKPDNDAVDSIRKLLIEQSLLTHLDAKS